jgi:hypothetical protein
MPKRQKVSYAQKSLPFVGQGRTVAPPMRREWRAVALAGASVLVLAVLYGYAVVSSIAHVSYRESALEEARLLTSERSTLEGAYLAKTSGITEQYARSVGYRDASDKVFISEQRTLSYAPDAR